MELLESTAKPLTPRLCPPAEFASGSTAQLHRQFVPSLRRGRACKGGYLPYEIRFRAERPIPRSISTAPTCGASRKWERLEKRLVSAARARDEAGRLVNAASDDLLAKAPCFPNTSYGSLTDEHCGGVRDSIALIKRSRVASLGKHYVTVTLGGNWKNSERYVNPCPRRLTLLKRSVPQNVEVDRPRCEPCRHATGPVIREHFRLGAYITG
jgi:hypothetical protein